MSTKADANRRNAQKSTGPKTTAGKRRAAKNAVRHGLSSWRPEAEPGGPTERLAEALQAEEPRLTAASARQVAEIIILLDRIAAARSHELRRAEAELLVRGMQQAPLHLVEDLAQLIALPRLRALHNREVRAHQRLRKALKAAY